MASKVMFVELTIYERIFPLVSGYLQAYACKDPMVKEAYSFEKYSTTVKTPYETVLRDLLASDADVYAISCYVWNMGLVNSLLKEVLERRPDAYFLLGGPQVMHHGFKYLSADHENLVLCNGEGERTFYEFLRELMNDKPDLSNVPGLSFYRDNELITTEKPPRILELDEIPSPFLTGLFDKLYSMAIFETNRGCPFSCGFCYWGAATNSKVIRFSEERIREELTWLSEHDCVFIYIADANWGLFPRDIALTEHIATLAQTYQMPSVVYYSAAKNRPERMTQITEIFTNAGVITSQPVSLQTMNETSLDLIDRKNIKLESYIELQERLNEKNISSFTELIWPLPGETVETLKAGVGRLCEAKADTIIIYPHILLNNTSLYKKRTEFGLVTRHVEETVGEVEIVVETADVNYEQFQQGLRFFYSLHMLHNMRSLYATSGYLHKKGLKRRSELFSEFADYFNRHRDSPLADFCERSIETLDCYDVFNYGKVVHYALHEYRESFDELLGGFVSTQEWWDDPTARAVYEIDLINRPYVYSNTPIKEKRHSFEHLKVLDITPNGYVVDLREEHLALLRELVGMDEIVEGWGNVFLVDHKKRQYPHMKAQGLDHNAGYCHGMIIRIQNILPTWAGLAVSATRESQGVISR